jgi:hypothetical protein
MKRIVGLTIACLFVSCFSSVMYARLVTFVNKTDDKLGFITLNRPFTRADIPDVSLIYLRPNQEITLTPQGRIIGWYQRGMPARFTVLDQDDTIVAFIEHGGEIKSLHGQPKTIKLTNSKPYSLIAETKNPHQGEQDCAECAQNCYHRDGTTKWCACLNWCWDHTRDMSWYLHSGAHTQVTVGSGTKIGLFEAEEVGNNFDCQDGYCDRVTTIRTITKTRYVFP